MQSAEQAVSLGLANAVDQQETKSKPIESLIIQVIKTQALKQNISTDSRAINNIHYI